MSRFTYPATLTPDKKDGGYVVTFRDLPEAITQGDTVKECLTEAADCLEEAIAARITDGLAIPKPSRPRRSERLVALSGQMALKAALYLAMRDAGLSKVELAKRLRVNEKEVRRMLDPRHGTKLPAMEQALAKLGKHLSIEIRDAA